MSAPHAAFARPGRVVLEGRYTRLEPLALVHVEDLYAASRDADGPERYRYLFDEPPASREALTGWVERQQALDDPLYFAVVDKATGRAEGRQALMRIVPKDGVVELGGIFWGPRLARTRIATEAFYLHARYAFETLGNRRFEWKCNDRNAPSKRAAQRFGLSHEGLFRQHMIVKGESRDTAWFALLDTDWPGRRAGFEAWLEPGNFDADGRQKQKLAFPA